MSRVSLSGDRSGILSHSLTYPRNALVLTKLWIQCCRLVRSSFAVHRHAVSCIAKWIMQPDAASAASRATDSIVNAAFVHPLLLLLYCRSWWKRLLSYFAISFIEKKHRETMSDWRWKMARSSAKPGSGVSVCLSRQRRLSAYRVNRKEVFVWCTSSQHRFSTTLFSLFHRTHLSKVQLPMSGAFIDSLTSEWE